MKIRKLLTKTLLAALSMFVGGNAVWAQTLPTPVYFNDFSSTEGLTVVGNGEFITDADSRFGQIFHNDPTNSSAVRTNYLKLPSDVLTHSAVSKEMTIGFWVNKKDEDSYFFAPLFAAYGAAPSDGTNGMPMFVCETRGLLQLNCAGWCDFGINSDPAGSQFNDGTPYVSTVWLDDAKWHYYTVVLTSTTAKVYVDGELKNGWTVDGTTDGQVISGLFEHGADLSYVTLGGNQAWGWKDADPAFGFDDFAVYDAALTADQIEQVIENKLTFNYTINAVDGNNNVIKELASGTSTEALSLYYPLAFENNGIWYTTSETTFLAELDATTPTKNVVYSVNNNIKSFKEGESIVADDAFNDSYSNGKYGHVAGGKKESLGTLPLGVYTLHGKLIERADRGIYLRNLGESDNSLNTIVSLVDKNSTPGIYSAQFSLTNATEVGVSGYTSGNSLNQSAGFDYVYITRDDIASAILDCKNNVKSEEFETAIDAETFNTVEDIYAFHTAWQIEHGDLTDGKRDITGVIRNAAVYPDATDWDGATIFNNVVYTGAPDKVALDRFGSKMWATQTVYGLPAGTYVVEVNTRGGVGSYSHIYINRTPWQDPDLASIATDALGDGETAGTLGYGWSKKTVTFTINETTNILLGFYADGENNKWASCDDWHMYRVESIPTTIGTNGYATFASPYALNLATLPEGLTAYKANVEGTTVKFTQVTEAVQGNTGLLLKGTASAPYSIPVVAEGNDIAESNEFLVNVEGTKFTGDEAYYYFAMKAGSNPLLFALFNPSNVAVPSSKAYLKVLKADYDASGARLNFVFDDVVTGIRTIDNQTIDNSSVYDLQGRRVANPARGLYIVNGKKVVIK